MRGLISGAIHAAPIWVGLALWVWWAWSGLSLVEMLLLGGFTLAGVVIGWEGQREHQRELRLLQEMEEVKWWEHAKTEHGVTRHKA